MTQPHETPQAPQSKNSSSAHAAKQTSSNVDMLATAHAAQGDDTRFFRSGAIKLIAPAKVNLYLDIGDVRHDGYHNATTIMHALTLHDVLYMRRIPEQGKGLSIDLTCAAFEGTAPLDVEPEHNIVSKAIRALAKRMGRICDETLVVRLEKHIPSQAGLGGGSSNAAAALVGAAHLWGLAPDDARIEDVARTLGADVAFFLHGGCACFTGVGEDFLHELRPMGLPVVVVKPEGGVSTAEAYRTFDAHPEYIDAADRKTALAARCAQEVPLRNNLEGASELLMPELADIRTWLSAHEGVEDVLMSGSGSAIFARCSTLEATHRIAAAAQACGWWARATTFGPVRAAIVPRS